MEFRRFKIDTLINNQIVSRGVKESIDQGLEEVQWKDLEVI